MLVPVVAATIPAADLPPNLAAHPAITALGLVPHGALIDEWLTASAIFYPSTVQAFDYPLAEARTYGMSIINLTRDWRSGTTGISEPVG